MDNSNLQQAYFGTIRHDVRFNWQTNDTFVLQREHAAIRPFVERILQKQPQATPIKILESGCGQGVNMIHLAQMGVSGAGVEVSGIDFTPEAIEEAKKHGLQVQVANGLALPFADGIFDFVFTRDVLHHLADDEERKAFVAEMKRVVKPGGVVAAVEPNPYNPMLFGLSVMIRAERGIQEITESHIKTILPGCTVYRTVPSAAWRGWYHYRSPLYAVPALRGATQFLLRQWEKICKYLPTTFWACRVYIWEKH